MVAINLCVEIFRAFTFIATKNDQTASLIKSGPTQMMDYKK